MILFPVQSLHPLRTALSFLLLILVYPSNRLNIRSSEINGRPGGTRTPNIRIWSPALYPLELLAFFLATIFRFLFTVNRLKTEHGKRLSTLFPCEFCGSGRICNIFLIQDDSAWSACSLLLCNSFVYIPYKLR